MTRQKSVAAAFLGGALLVGGLLGFTADRLMLRTECRREWDQRTLRTRLAEDLRLDEAQRASVDGILDRRSARTRALIDPIRPQLDSAVWTARDEIRAILSADQLVKFEEMVRETDAEDDRRRAQRDSADAAQHDGAASDSDSTARGDR
ncbi:MAG TPA: hypothetical protein VGE02_09200 [Gemmatimonadales bacterium]